MSDENIEYSENEKQLEEKKLKKKKRPIENTSGMGEKATIPASIQKFNWGAFFFSFIWGLFNKTYITLLILLLGIIPVVNIGVLIWFGIKGNEWAWRNKRWNSAEHFNKVQKNWAIAGVITLVIAILSLIITFVMSLATLFSAISGSVEALP